jgi:hypothetical protein
MVMVEPIFLLSPPRSFSSVVSSILGQHPELYCFPELHLLYRDDIGHLLSNKSNIKYARFAPSGLLRAIAQVHEGKQDSAACSRAWMWLVNNQSMTSKELFEYLCQPFYPKACIDKSPPNTKTIDRMVRLFKFYPNARFIHLTRSFVGASKSLKEFFEFRRTVHSPAAGHPMVKENYALMWYAMHRNILKFRSIVPPSNFLTVSGEAILSDPRVVLPQICRWLGVSSDSSCIDAMLKPEESPYAFYGPRMAPCGNDPKFITNPEFRQMKRKKYSREVVREFLASNGKPAFTSYYLNKLEDEDAVARLKSWDFSMLELVMDMEAQLGYA